GLLLLRRKPEEAHPLLEQALALGKAETKRPLAAAAVLQHVGDFLAGLASPAEAREFYAAALEVREKLAPGSSSVAESLSTLGGLALSQGDLEGAQACYLRALAIRQK